jgi:hypothetical protein
MLKEHLKYEFDMLDEAYRFLFDGNSDRHDEDRKKPFIRNAVIESFWTHARNLNEFFDHHPDHSVTVSARDFTVDDVPFKATLDETLTKTINQQISHLQYGRPTDPVEKLSSAMHRVYDTMFSAITEFQRRLKPEARKLWIERKRALPKSTQYVWSANVVSTSTTTAGFGEVTVVNRDGSDSA